MARLTVGCFGQTFHGSWLTTDLLLTILEFLAVWLAVGGVVAWFFGCFAKYGNGE